MEFKDLTPEQQEKIKACKTPEELNELVQEYGEELTDEDLAAISGGSWTDEFAPAGECDDFDSFDMV